VANLPVSLAAIERSMINRTNEQAGSTGIGAPSPCCTDRRSYRLNAVVVLTVRSIIDPASTNLNQAA
jgi:hypothetical protein